MLRITLILCASVALLAAACGTRDDPPAPQQPATRYKPPPEPSVCTAFERVDRPLPPRPAPSGCGWIPAPREPRRLTIRTTRPYCWDAFTTGDGDFFTNVTAIQDEGYQYAFVSPAGEILYSFAESDPLQSFAPLETKVTGIYYPLVPDPAPPHRIRRAPVMVSLDVDGEHGATIVEYHAIPPWYSGGGRDCVLPYPAVGKAVAMPEAQGYLGGYEWLVYVWVFDEDASVCGVPWVAAQDGGLAGRPMPRPYIAVDENMNVLVLLDFAMFFGYPGLQTARWFSIDGTPLTDEFEAPIGHAACSHVCFGMQPALVPLVGGGVAYQEGQQWLAFFPSAEPRVEPAPPWLSEWNFHTLHQVGGRGYALIPFMGPDSPTCEDRVEFVSAYGERCGTMMLDEVWPCGSGWRVFVGRDGSVIQRGPIPTVEKPDDCEFAIWDRLLE
jgi:hypothetical protein